MRYRTNNPAARAFTLIEILIVVVILGILAAIVIPQCVNAADDANESSVLTQLQTIRSQIELYNVQNPATAYDSTTTVDATFWDPLLNGNYLASPPKNPLNGNLTTVGGAVDAANGWVWADLNGWGHSVYAVDNTGAAAAEFDADGDGNAD